MMTIQEFILDYYRKQYPDWEFESLSELFNEIIYDYEVWKKDTPRRWWNVIVYILEIENRFFAIPWAYTTGDSSPEDLGWEFNENEIYEVERIEKVITTYEYKKLK